MKTETPRTDDQIGHAGSTMSLVRIEFARQLERELAASRAQVARLREALSDALSYHNGDLDSGFGWEQRAVALLKETNPNATVPVTSRGRWDSQPHLCTVCGQNPVNPHDGIDTCDTCNP